MLISLKIGLTQLAFFVSVVVIEQSPRRRAMENQDILGEIFNIISLDLETPGNNASQTRKNLFYAARTCRIFLDPAINALWRVLPSLFPLLKLLPSFQLVNNQYVRFKSYLSFLQHS